MDEAVIRPLLPSDSMSELTAMIHRAYAPLAAAGMRFVATAQDEATTRRRCSNGECWVAERDGRLVGTVTWGKTVQPHDPPHYAEPGVAIFEQFAVEPSLQRGGLGGRLLERVEERAAVAGYARLACDTAVPAAHLIAYYERRGFAIVARHRWSMTNYESVVLSKELRRR